jgi:hypothetical protein
MLFRLIILMVCAASEASAEVCLSNEATPACYVYSDVIRELETLGFELVKPNISTGVARTSDLKPSFETDFNLSVENADDVLSPAGLLIRQSDLEKLHDQILKTLLRIGCDTGATEHLGLNDLQLFVSAGGVLVYRITVYSDELFSPERALSSHNFQPLSLSDVTITSCEAP